jgi:hypothetical protein
MAVFGAERAANLRALLRAVVTAKSALVARKGGQQAFNLEKHQASDPYRSWQQGVVVSSINPLILEENLPYAQL